MSRDCRAEECPMWDGDTCPCATFDLDPDDLPESGIFRVEAMADPLHRDKPTFGFRGGPLHGLTVDEGAQS